MLSTLRLYDLHAGQTLFLQSGTTWSDGADVQVQCGAGGVSKGREKLRSGRPVPACFHAGMSVSLTLLFFSCGRALVVDSKKRH